MSCENYSFSSIVYRSRVQTNKNIEKDYETFVSVDVYLNVDRYKSRSSLRSDAKAHQFEYFIGYVLYKKKVKREEEQNRMREFAQ